MTDAQRIERLERVLSILIVWLHKELGIHATSTLLDQLQEGDE